MQLDYYVYIVRCNDGSYYTGVTNNWLRRLAEHNEGIDSRSYTFSRRPVSIVHVVHFHEIIEAITWEKIVKRWSRKKKEALINGQFEKLQELSLGTAARKVRMLVGMVRRTHHDNFATKICSASDEAPSSLKFL